MLNNKKSPLICLDDGQEISPHPEPYAVLFHIIDGEGTITVGTKRHDALPGHMIFVPGNSYTGNSTAHAYEPARDTTATLSRSSMLQ